MTRYNRIKNAAFLGLSFLFLSNQLYADFDDYLNDIKRHSVLPHYAWGAKKNLQESYEYDSTPLYGRAVDLKHDQFNGSKETLISEWQEAYGMTWPTYSEDVYITRIDRQGRKYKKRIRKADDRYDAHHIIPQSHNGPNEWWNLVPLTVGNHIRFHNPKSSQGEECCELFRRSCGLRTRMRV